MKNLKIDNILLAYNSIEINKDDTYLKTYNDFIEFFASKPTITKNDFVIGSHLVYGWMPTIISFNFDNIENNVKYLNDVKNGKLLSESELESLKKAVNNSIVGVSKLLHFISPENYAIWDSRIHRFVTGKKSSYGVNTISSFMKYQAGLRELAKHPITITLQSNIQKIIGYNISKLRTLEMVMFEFDKNGGS
ncbi:hypothetical protein ACXR6G_11515 [Ancylomarina sp. YFZ004]